MNNISKVLGWKETPSFTEGLFLQPEEATTIDTALGKISADSTALETANKKVTEQEGSIKTLQDQAQKDQATIANLQAENKKLGGESSGNKGSTVTTTAAADTKEESGNEKITYNSDNHPANRYADGKKSYQGLVKK